MTDLFGDSASPALALARKWRPRVFADLKGQEHVVQALSNALTQGRLHHAYLLTGTRGVGKTTLARILAKCLNCETGVTATPCGTCSACTQIDAGRFVDLLELDAATTRSTRRRWGATRSTSSTKCTCCRSRPSTPC
jgi:DNA polymerase-3 subunit gamma/tau